MMTVPDKQKALIETALRFVGVQEQGYNDGPEVRIFQSIISKPMHQSWCMDYAQWCVREVDKKFHSKTVLYPSEACVVTWLHTQSSAKTQIPEPGSIVIWGHYNGNTPTSKGHTGIVKEVLDHDWILVCEGNTGPDINGEINRQGDGVYLKRRRSKITTGSMRTLGYIRPWIF